MPTQGWSQNIVTQDAAGVLFNTFTTAKSVINQNCLYPFYANYFKPGQKMRITAHMNLSNIVTTPGTITFQVMLNSVIAFTTGAIQLNATTHTLAPAKLVIDLCCQLGNTTVSGAVAKLMGAFVLSGVMFTKTAGQVDGVNSETVITGPVAGYALGTPFDGTIAETLDFFAGFSISAGGNGIQMAMYDVDLTT